MKGFLIGLAGLTAIGLSGSALANLTSDGVNVQIDVQPIASVWAEHENITLVMDGSDPDGNNMAFADSGLFIQSNFPPKLEVRLDGQLPPPGANDSGIHFFVVQGTLERVRELFARRNPYSSDAYAEASWNYSTIGTTRFFGATGISIVNPERIRIVYAVTSPDGTPLPGEWSLTVLYTISPDD